MDYAYDAYGRCTQETKPYLLAVWTQAAGGTPYRGQYLNNPKTVTSYDAFGRVSKVQSPTPGEAITTTYPADLQVRQCNGRDFCTLTLYDVWGRVAEVRPPAEPWLRYSYDEADRLVRVEQRTGGGATLFTRFTSGVTPTSVRFTGQREEAALGLYYYNARWHDPALGHFLSPDTIVPEAGNALDYHSSSQTKTPPCAPLSRFWRCTRAMRRRWCRRPSSRLCRQC